MYGPRIGVLGSRVGTQHEAERLVHLVDVGDFSSVIDREYPLTETEQTFRGLGNADMVGNVGVTP